MCCSKVSHAKSPPGLVSASFSKRLHEGMDSFADFADLLLPFVKIRHTIKNNNRVFQTGVFKELSEFKEDWKLNSFPGDFQISNFYAKN